MNGKFNRRGFLGALIGAITGTVAWTKGIVRPPPIADLALWPSPTPNPGLFGLQYHQINGNHGFYMGIPRTVSSAQTVKLFNIQVPKTTPSHVDHFRIPGSFHRYIENERLINA